MRFLIWTLLIPLVMIAQPDKASIDSLNALEREFIFSNIEQSIEIYESNAKAARSMGYPAGEAAALSNLGLALYLHGDYDKSVASYLSAIRLLEKLHMFEELSYAYGDLGYQMKRRDLPRARRYMRTGIRIAEKYNFREKLCALYDNYGVLKDMSDDADSAMYFYEKALQLKSELNDSIGIPFSLNNIAVLHTRKHRFKLAEEYLRASDAFRQKETGTYGRLVNSVLWGDLFFEKQQYDSALAYYRGSIEMPGADEQNYLVSYCYEQLTAIYTRLGDYRNALDNFKLYSAYKDSLVNALTNSRIAALEVEFESEKKDRRIAENQLKIATQQRQLILLGAAVLLVLLLSWGSIRYLQLKRAQEKRALILENRLKQAEFQQKLIQEKYRISQELHDNIGSHLTFLISSMDNMGYSDVSEDLRPTLSSLGQFARTTLRELRQTVWALKNNQNGLEAILLKLNELRQYFSNNLTHIDLDITSEIDRPVSLSSAQMLNLLRIAQEGVQNAVKHAEATKISVRLYLDDDHIGLTVRDNGHGFDVQQSKNGSGLSNMRQRCTACDGIFNLHSDSNGTTIDFRMKLE